MATDSKTAVIIPAYNEGKHIKRIIRKIKRYVNNVIVVDDGSSDNTQSELKKENIILLTHLVNLGKGAALTTGIKYAQGLGFSKVIFMDSDGQHNPDDLMNFKKNLKKHDFVIGYRKLNFRANGIRYLGNQFNRFLISILFGKSVLDPICGFRAFDLNIYPKIKWESIGYGVETEMIIRVILKKIDYIEIPVSTIYIDKYKGVSILDAYKVFFDMLKWRISL